MTNPKFVIGDLVKINEVMPSTKSHFPCNKHAVVTHYRHNNCQKDSSFEHRYTLYVKGEGNISWYFEPNITLIKHNQMSLISQWEDIEKVEAAICSCNDPICERDRQAFERLKKTIQEQDVKSEIKIPTCEECIDHLKAVWDDSYITVQTRNAIDEILEFIIEKNK